MDNLDSALNTPIQATFGPPAGEQDLGLPDLHQTFAARQSLLDYLAETTPKLGYFTSTGPGGGDADRVRLKCNRGE